MIVRALVGDDPVQAAKARATLTGDFLVTASVLAEAEWVLRSQYRWPRSAIADALSELGDLPNMVEAPAGMRWAIERFAAGADFADMLHLISADAATRFATFDKRLARKAGPNPPLPIETLA